MKRQYDELNLALGLWNESRFEFRKIFRFMQASLKIEMGWDEFEGALVVLPREYYSLERTKLLYEFSAGLSRGREHKLLEFSF